MKRSAVLVSLVAIGAGTLPAVLGQDKKPEKVEIRVVNGARVYFPVLLATGDRSEKLKPGFVRSRRVFDAIPEYQEVRKRDLDPNSAEYLLFMKKASDRFKDAVSRTVHRGGYDLVSECGAISVKDPKAIPDITDEVIANL